MTYAVVFTSNDAVIIKRIVSGQRASFLFNKAMSPNLDEVRQVPTKYWKLKGRKVVPMNDLEKRLRDLHIQVFGTDHITKRRLRFHINFTGKLISALKPVSLLAIGAIGGYFVRTGNF